MAKTIQQRIDEAEEVLHQLNLGQSVVEVEDADGKKVRYNQTSITRLQTYITRLKESQSPPGSLGAMGVEF